MVAAAEVGLRVVGARGLSVGRSVGSVVSGGREGEEARNG